MIKITKFFRKQELHSLLFSLVIALILSGCSSDMRDQPRYEPYEASAFFPDNQSARPIPEGAVPFERVVEDDVYYTGQTEEGFTDTFPFEVTEEVLLVGRENYDIFCAPCHGLAGYGDGMIVERGFPAPPSFHTDRLRQMPPGQIYDVITNGFGRMYSYAYRVPPAERWAITAYMRALQLSQNAAEDDVPSEALDSLEGNQ